MDRLQVQKPFVIYSTDNYFYLKSKKPTFSSPSFIRINRETSKATVLAEPIFFEQVQAGEKKIRDQICMLLGVIVINKQPYLCLVRQAQPVATLNNQRIFCIKNVEFIPFKHKYLYKSIDQTDNEKIIQEMSDSIIHNNFYFCYKSDLTLTYQKQIHKKPTESKYFWNENMLSMFVIYDLPMCWRIPVIQGYAKEIYSENNYFSYYFCSISRRSKFMSGTRFHNRGIDSDCNCSNFVQTEQIFICHNFLFSHVSLRGSVPIYWNQAQFGAPIKFPRSDEDNMAVIERHYELLKKQYQSNIVSINLLSKNKSPQSQLKNRFQFYLFRTLPTEPYIQFDLNEEIKQRQSNKIIDTFIRIHSEMFAPKYNYLCLDRYTNQIFSQQSITPRINCLDCLDRTNVVMSRISLIFLEQITQHINANANMHQKKLKLGKEYLDSVIEMWADIGNRISVIYSGTESTATHLTKQEENSFFSFITGGFKSINRYYNANVNDGFKQTCLDFLLGQKYQNSKTQYFDDNISKVLEQTKYCTFEQAVMYVLTWNCNTVDPQKLTQKDKQKLFNFPVERTDILVVCLQQMVQLNSYNVLIGDNINIVEKWKNVIEKHLHDISIQSKKAYVYLTSYDMVGIATFVFISGAFYNRVSHQQWTEVKTGFKNNLGNKGAIILFLQIDQTNITMINCHLAAGENASGQRQQDLQYIHNDALNDRDKWRLFDKSQFKFLIGDTNFRLQAKNQQVRQILYTIEKQDSIKKLAKAEIQSYLQKLLIKDEYFLNNKTGILSTYKQGNIYFLPTYKYVKKEKIYDTKRTPSWCDRILFYSSDLKKIQLIKYWDVDCYQSDHKPVFAAFKLRIKKEDFDKRQKLVGDYMKKEQTI